MTEPNKELPKEVVEKIRQSAIHEVGGDYEGGAKGIIKDGIIQRKTEGAEIAQSHYAPIIEAKDKEIAELNNGFKNSMEVLTENGERIAELEATIDFNNIHNATAIYMKDATISKLMGLLKEEKFNDWGILNSVTTLNLNVYNEWEAYCAENGIDLGGE